MIKIELTNPFSKRWETIYYKSSPPPSKGKHRVWEVQAFKDNTVVSIALRWTFRTDHAGIELGLGLFGYSIMFSSNDTRHWDNDINAWKVYDNGTN